MIAMSLVNPLASTQAATTTSPSVSNRLFGQDRYQTSVAIAEAYNNGLTQKVILASGNDFPDALSASILSKKLNAPIILVDTTAAASSEAFNYINAHVSNTGTVYIIGGTAIIGTDFETKLGSMGYNNIKRLGGTDRYGTDMLIVNEANVPQGTPVFIASGENFPDALSVSSFSGAKQYPILLVGENTLSSETEDYITNHKPSTVYIAGGTGVISKDIENQIKALVPSATVKRLAGNDRFDTTGAVLNEFSTAPKTIYLANGYNFPDALAGSALAAMTGDPILLVDNQSTLLPSAIETYLKKLYSAGIQPNVTVLGGTGIVPDILIQQAENALEGKLPIVTSKIARAGSTYYYLDSSSHVWAWGFGYDGELGNGTITAWDYQSPPVQVSNLSSVVAIAAEGQTSFALDKSGHVWAWGCGGSGALGNGTTTFAQSTPVQVSNLSNIVAIAGGTSNGYALDSFGHVWAWGEGVFGELGNGTTTKVQSTPVQVSSLSNIIAIAGGLNTGYALDSSGHIWAWGRGYVGALGNGTTTEIQSTPVQVSNISNIVAIASAGDRDCYALDSTGHVWAWGDGNSGELGNGHCGEIGNERFQSTQSTPVQVSNLSDIVAIAGSSGNGYALDKSGCVWAWGDTSNGALGNVTTTICQSTPIKVSNLSNIVAIDAEFALDSSCQVWVWGGGKYGDGTLHNGTTIKSATPVQVPNIPPK